MLKLASNPCNIVQVENFVQKLVSQYKISPDKQCNILISLTEAVTNAMIHGNHKDESKMVQVRLNKVKNNLSFRVSDQGSGFDYKSVPDPTAPENITKCGGRGVFLMQQLSDDIRFFDEGRTVEIQFKL